MFGPTEATNFEEAMLPHLDAAYNLARWLMRNDHDAQDAVQEAYLRAFRFYPSFRGGEGRAWLMKIVRNTCFTMLRGRRVTQNSAEFDENALPPDAGVLNPEEIALQDDSAHLVRRAMESLPPNVREILILREIEGMSYREIASVADLPMGTVMSALSRARTRLREALIVLGAGKAWQASSQESTPLIEKQTT
jgi:RNA polymerase sigma-70 factor, ECF subfamily